MDTKRSSLFNWLLFGGLGLLFVLSLVWLNIGNLAGDAPAWELVVNVLLLSVPLGLLYGSIALLVIAVRQHRGGGHIQPQLARWLYWAPRLAGILIILFISMFALDVFGQGLSLGQVLVALFMHLLPSFVLIALLALAWRWEWLGFWMFLAAAVFFFILTGGDILYAARELDVMYAMYLIGNSLLFVLPLFLIALLFRVNWDWRDELRPGAQLTAA